jgi:3-oxoacyl-[acyl-carrier protein] reductase
MDLGLKGKVALVTAASKGIGRAIAEELAAEGATVGICARGDALLNATRDAIAARTGATVHAIAADVGTPEGIARVTSAVIERCGRIDVLVGNAGGPPTGTFTSLDWNAWQAAVDLTLRSAVELTRAVLPGMRERRWGRVIHITSLTVKQPIDGLMLSTSIRAAVTGFTRTLANETAGEGVTVNTILPGYMNTERVVELAEATAKREGVAVAQVEQRQVAAIPMRRLGEPRELAALAAFLASERASYITGQAWIVDGGWARGLL